MIFISESGGSPYGTEKEREGLLDVPGGRVWYRIAGDGPGVPLLLLHGGPGADHDYLEPLGVLGDERPVFFYDQLGCGKSDIPGDTSLWTIERFVAEPAVFTFYQKHLCRTQPWPPEMLRTGLNIQNSPVYRFMWGPSEFTCTGNLKAWDRSDRIAEITAPTIITVGRYDEIPLPLAEEMHHAIAGSQLVVFEESSHSSHVKEPELHAQVLRDFFRSTEAAA